MSCASAARRRYPAASREAVTSYLRAGLVDRLDLSTGLLEPSAYAGWGLTRQDAQREAWDHVVSQGWDGLTRLQSRKALAAPGGYGGGKLTDQGRPRHLRGHAARGRCPCRRCLDLAAALLGQHRAASSTTPCGRTPSGSGLRRRRDEGAVFFTHMTPSAMPTDAAGIARECAVVAQVFSAVFVAAGTG